jgi:hypothetical protein
VFQRTSLPPRLERCSRRSGGRTRSDLLGEAERIRYEAAIASRLTNEDPESPWLTLPRAAADLDELIAEAEATEGAFLQEHRAHLADRLACGC